MVLSKRERYIVIGTALVVFVLVLDTFALSPLMEARDATTKEKNDLTVEMARGRATLKQASDLAPRWLEINKSGLKDDPGDAESQVLHSMRDWMEKSRVEIALLKPERLTDKTQLPQVVIQASGNGTMDSIARLLWRIQTATIPIRITELQISARKEGADDLSVQLRLTTVYSPASTRSATSRAVTSSPSGGGQ